MKAIDADLLIGQLQKKVKTERSTIEIRTKLIPMIEEMESVNQEDYKDCKVYDSTPVCEKALLDELCENDRAALVAWFRCNSCCTCAFRERVLPKINRSIHWCACTHDRYNIIDMVNVLEYSRE